MRTFATLIAILAVIFSIGCKPRLANSSLSAVHEDIETNTLWLGYYRAFSQEVGFYVNSHPAFAQIMDMAIKAASNLGVPYYKFKMDAINFLAKEMLQHDFPSFVLTRVENEGEDDIRYIELKKRDLTFYDLVDWAHLVPSTAPSCTNPEALGLQERKHKVCYTFETCNLAIHGLGAFVDVGQKQDNFPALMKAEADSRGIQASDIESPMVLTDRLWADLRDDVQCLPPSRKRETLLYMVDSRIVHKDFKKIVRFKDLYRPQMLSDQRSGDIVSRLRQLTKQAETDFLSPQDPNLLRKDLLQVLMEEGAWMPLLNWDFEKNQAEEDRWSNFAKVICEGEECEAMRIEGKDGDLGTVEQVVDKYAQQVVAAYTVNMALKEYLDRVPLNDIRPWLERLDSKVTDWLQWRRANQSSHQPRPPTIEHLSPTIAFGMMTVFWDKEAFLPFRHAYLAKMRSFVQRFQEFGELNDLAYVEKFTTADKTINVMQGVLDYYDEYLLETARKIHLFSDGSSLQSLLRHETNAAQRFPDYFHSLGASFGEYQEAAMEYLLSVAQLNELNQEFESKQLLEKRVGEIEKKMVAARSQGLFGTLELACLGYALSDTNPKFFTTGIKARDIDCWPWLHRAYQLGQSSFTKTETGFEGDFDLSRICRTQGPSPISWAKTYQISHAQKETDECTGETIRTRQEAYTVAVAIVTMPIMGHLGGMATQMLFAFARQSAAAGLVVGISSRLGISTMTRTLASIGILRWGGQTVGRIVVTGLSHMLSATFFEVGNRLLYAGLGWAPLVRKDACKDLGISDEGWTCAIADWTKAIAVNTVIFTGFGLARGLSEPIAARMGRLVPTSSWKYTAVVGGSEFLATTAFFAHTTDMLTFLDSSIKSTTGVDLKLHNAEEDRGLFYRYIHAAIVTASFGLHRSLVNKVTPSTWQTWAESKGFSIKMPSGIEHLRKLEIARRQRLNMVPHNLLNTMYVTEPKVPESGNQSPEVLGGPTPKKVPDGQVEMKPGYEHVGVGILNGFDFFLIKESNFMRDLKLIDLVRLSVQEGRAGRVTASEKAWLQREMVATESAFQKELATRYQATQSQYQRLEKQAPTAERAILARKMQQHADKMFEVMKDQGSRLRYVEQLLMMRAQLELQTRAFEANPGGSNPSDSNRIVPAIGG